VSKLEPGGIVSNSVLATYLGLAACHGSTAPPFFVISGFCVGTSPIQTEMGQFTSSRPIMDDALLLSGVADVSSAVL